MVRKRRAWCSCTQEHDHDGAAAASEWSPADGLERTLYTSTVTVATAVGFAFLLLAGLLVSGDQIDARRALGWSAAGFVVTGLAPALGLPPELPGMLAADLVERQTWWIATAIATAAALWLILRSRGLALPALGVVLLIAPHIVGAPHPGAEEASRVPAELAARFASASLVVHAALWALTGALVGWLWQTEREPGRGRGLIAPMSAASIPDAPMTDEAMTVFVCVSCRRAAPDGGEGFDLPGRALAEALQERLCNDPHITVTPVECLAVCNRPSTIALVGRGRWTYLIGNLATETHLDQIVEIGARLRALGQRHHPLEGAPRVLPQGRRSAHSAARLFSSGE